VVAALDRSSALRSSNRRPRKMTSAAVISAAAVVETMTSRFDKA
jgi:hypothetical protein